MNIFSKIALCGLVMSASVVCAISPYRMALPMVMRYVRPVYRPVPVVRRVVPVQRIVPVHRVPVLRPLVNPFFARPVLYRPVLVRRPALRPLVVGAAVRRGGVFGGFYFN